MHPHLYALRRGPVFAPADGGGAPAEDTSTISDALSAAWDAAEKGAQAEPAPRAKAEEPAPAADPKPDGSKTDGARVRGPDGKFIKADTAPAAKPEAATDKPAATAQQPAQVDPAAAPAEGQGEAAAAKPLVEPPAGISAAGAADWAKTPPSVQAEVGRLLTEAVAPYKGFEPLMPHIQGFSNALKVAPSDLVQQWAQVQQELLSGPQRAAQAVAWIARQYGIPLGGQQAAAPAPGQAAHPAGQQQPALPPELQSVLAPVVQTVEQLRAHMLGRQQAEAQANDRAIQDQITAFARDPAHPHFASVQGEMGKLIHAGLATSLQDAYEKACWASPVIRAQITAAEQAATEAQRASEAKARATRAAAASSSVSGAPGTSTAGATPASVREALEAAWADAN